ncbi:hypothetical protein HR13_07040 [Porphyromonas gulae]|nr:hypothetical protein HR09_04440 [Porphyromonas gulae]KGN79493.1 hypothetical protein HR13_07040 [Porphyromonas gulae]
MAEKGRRKLRDDIFDPKKLLASCGGLFQCEFVVPQLAARFFRSEMLSRNLRKRISCPICRFARRTNCTVESKKVAPTWRKAFRCGFVFLQVGAVNFVSDLQVYTPDKLHCGAEMQISRRTIAFS